MIVDPDNLVDVCSLDPGFDVDLFVNADLKAMAAVWMRIEDMSVAREDRRIMLTGDEGLSNSIEQWLGSSIFADVDRKVA